MLQMGYKHHIVGGKRHEQYRNLNTLNPSPLPHFIWSYFGWVTEWLRYSDIGVNDGGLMGWWTPSSLQRLDFQYLTLQWSDKWRDSRSTCPLCNWKTIHFCKRTACLCSCQHDLNLAAAKLLQEMISIISDSLAYCSSLEGCPYLLSPRPFAPSVQQWPGHLGQHGKKKKCMGTDCQADCLSRSKTFARPLSLYPGWAFILCSELSVNMTLFCEIG